MHWIFCKKIFKKSQLEKYLSQRILLVSKWKRIIKFTYLLISLEASISWMRFKLSHKKMKTTSLWSISKSWPLTSTFFPIWKMYIDYGFFCTPNDVHPVLLSFSFASEINEPHSFNCFIYFSIYSVLALEYLKYLPEWSMQRNSSRTFFFLFSRRRDDIFSVRKNEKMILKEKI